MKSLESTSAASGQLPNQVQPVVPPSSAGRTRRRSCRSPGRRSTRPGRSPRRRSGRPGPRHLGAGVSGQRSARHGRIPTDRGDPSRPRGESGRAARKVIRSLGSHDATYEGDPPRGTGGLRGGSLVWERTHGTRTGWAIPLPPVEAGSPLERFAQRWWRQAEAQTGFSRWAIRREAGLEGLALNCRAGWHPAAHTTAPTPSVASIRRARLFEPRAVRAVRPRPSLCLRRNGPDQKNLTLTGHARCCDDQLIYPVRPSR